MVPSDLAGKAALKGMEQAKRKDKMVASQKAGNPLGGAHPDNAPQRRRGKASGHQVAGLCAPRAWPVKRALSQW